MFRTVNRLAFMALCQVVLVAPLSAQSVPASPENPVVFLEIDTLIEALDSTEFSAREQATQQLIQQGVRAIEAVTRAVDSQNLEVATRGITVLKGLYQSKDSETKQAAQAALAKLSESENRSVARRAHAILNPPDPAELSRRNMRRGNFQFQVRFGGGVGQRLQVQTRNINGNVEINVQENDRKVLITHKGGQDIVMKVTDALPGQPLKINEYKAKDFGDLKQKYPDASQIFEKYAGQHSANVKIVVGGAIVPQPGQAPAAPLLPPVPVAPVPETPARR